MRPDIEEPTPKPDDEEWETHPAWAMVGAYRVSSSPGAILFDSEIRHTHYVVVRLQRAERKRDLNRDWIHPKKQVVEFALSEAQWASFVSSMNTSGVPCTLEWLESVGQLPGMPYAPRMEESMDEVRRAGTKALNHIREAFAAVKEKPNKGNLRALEAAIENAPGNMAFAAESLTEHAENVVQKARVDIEAMVVAHARQLELDPAEVKQALLPEETTDKE